MGLVPLFILIVLRVWKAGILPGLHYDEAWFANYSYRIAFEPAFWPIDAMSPQTKPWIHYWVAGVFKALEPYFFINVFLYRSSLVFLTATGLFLIAGSLVQVRGIRQALCFLIWVAACPGLVLNHRFGIELTSLIPFCLGLFLYGISAIYINRDKKSGYVFIFLSVFFGVTAHVLFFSVWLSFLLTLFLCNVPLNKKSKITIVSVGGALSVFFIKIAISFSEKDKAVGLLAVNLFLMILPFLWNQLQLKLSEVLKTSKKGILILAAPLMVLCVFFAEGHWSIGIQLGKIAHPIVVGFFLIPLIWVLAKQFTVKSKQPEARFLFAWWCATLFMIFAMTPKPAPRYYEIAILLGFVWLSLKTVEAFGNKSIFYASIGLVFGATALVSNYFLPVIQAEQIQGKRAYFTLKNIRFGPLKDSSRDYAPKQEVANRLLELGCTMDRIGFEDMRQTETLRFLMNPKSNTQKNKETCSEKNILLRWGENGQLVLLEKK